MVSFSQRAHHPCWKPTLMLTELAALMTENQPVATVYFLAPILSYGALANSQPCHA